MLYTTEDDTEHVELDFSGSRRRAEDIWGYDSFGVRFPSATRCDDADRSARSDLEYSILGGRQRGRRGRGKREDHGVRY